MEISQMNFEIDQKQQCKEVYLENLPIFGDKMALIVSGSPSKKGYWIESTSSAHFLLDGQIAYIGEKALSILK